VHIPRAAASFRRTRNTAASVVKTQRKKSRSRAIADTMVALFDSRIN
jgi:hypothetical protein